MKRTCLIALALMAVVLVCPCIAWAHQPRIVKPNSGPVTVEQPEVSKAYYGELRGRPQLFEISSETPFVLYVNVLVPKIPDIEKNVSAAIYSGGKQVAALNGVRFKWAVFHEPFAGDDYYKGPEFSKRVEAGTYSVKVFSPINRGKYVLAIGEKEEFPFGEAMRAFAAVVRLKSDFFGKSPLSILTSYMGASAAAVVVVIAGIAYFSIRRVVRRRRKRAD